jgi:isopenicillin-N N-acyltransferase-like protein
MGIRTLPLAGSPEEVGSAHGETLRTEIRSCTDRWLDDLGSESGMSPRALVAEFLEQTTLIETAARLTPHLHGEVEAIARAAAIDRNLLWAWNLVDEMWWFMADRARGRSATDVTGCSAVAITAPSAGPGFVAQNMDLEAFITWEPLALQLEPDGAPAALVLTLPGCVALCGCNDRGVAVCCNALLQLRSSGAGLNVAFVVRRVLEQRTLASVRSLIGAVPHASGQNYVVGAPDGVASFECSAAQVAELGPTKGMIVHTNHPLVSSDVQRGGDQRNSEARQRFLEQTLQPAADRAAVQAALSDRRTPVCKVGDMGRTYASIVMELTAPPSVWTTPGPPTAEGFEPVSFRATDAAHTIGGVDG